MRLPTLKSREVISVLKRIGFEKLRQSGSHVVLVNRNVRKIIIIPVHAGKDLTGRKYINYIWHKTY